MKNRNASFELMRIVCMFMIVLYHVFWIPYHPTVIASAGYRTMMFPLHIAVVCFVLISGYFEINFSFKKLIYFFSQILFYNVLCYFGSSLYLDSFNVKDFAISFLPFSYNQDLWFIRTYMILFLISPILNRYLEFTPPRSFKIMCVILAFISVYLGIKSDDVTLIGGKNIINFIFIYFLGHGLRKGYFFQTLTLKSWVLLWLAFNILECTVFYLSFGHGLADKLSCYGWSYNAPLLIINAILFFMVFTKLKIDSSFVTSMARSVFPIYLIHSNQNVQNILWPIIKNVSVGNLLISNLIITVLIMMICILLDRLLAPCYHSIANCLINRINLKA